MEYPHGSFWDYGDFFTKTSKRPGHVILEEKLPKYFQILFGRNSPKYEPIQCEKRSKSLFENKVALRVDFPNDFNYKITLFYPYIHQDKRRLRTVFFFEYFLKILRF